MWGHPRGGETPFAPDDFGDSADVPFRSKRAW